MANEPERRVLLATLTIIALIIAFDLYTDATEGVVWWHLTLEGLAGLLALLGVFFLLRQSFGLRHDLTQAHARATELAVQAEEWRARSKAHVDGLALMIHQQLNQWKLTPAEQEVAFLLLKGLSLKEVASVRGTSEKTARAQSLAIYSKAGVTGRSELSAFFLEDLLPQQVIDG
ncbi:helix-turn-helix transcriptional regulator [Alteromonas flava]|uniref:helix-turn-helix transcriptional regulator n=1 Tax=Alteromonas flava TaxID=2048003 RepID=UPI000C290043|nr:helix-turn-helix transcriptional regulator [Alteromonas flava]